MLQDMGNYIKKLTDENEKLKEENYKLNDELSALYNCMNYWRDKYYKQLDGISTQLAVNLNDITELDIKKLADETVKELGKDIIEKEDNLL